MSQGDPISEIHLHDNGIDGSQYYPGFSPCRGYEGASGAGDNISEAIDDALEIMAQDGVGFLDEANDALLKQEGLTEWPTSPSASEGCLEAAREEAGLDPNDDSMDDTFDTFEMCDMDLYYYVGLCYIRGTVGIGGRFISPEDDNERGPNRFMDPPSVEDIPSEVEDEDLPPRDQGQIMLPFMEDNQRSYPHPQYDRFQQMIRDGVVCPGCFTSFANVKVSGIGNRQMDHKICGCNGEVLYPHDTSLIPGARRMFTYSMGEDSSFENLILRKEYEQGKHKSDDVDEEDPWKFKPFKPRRRR